MSHKLPDDRYLAALYRQRDRIIAGLEFSAVDSDTIGDKYTEASWGLCSDDPAAWPDRQDHLWPEQFDKGRVAPLYRTETQPCPMQRKGGGTGCFYSCRIFKGREVTKNTRAKAITLYEETIAKHRARLSGERP